MSEQDRNPEGDVLIAEDEAAPGVLNDNDSALGLDTASDTDSLRSSVLAYRQENGRTYHAYKDGSYSLPNDQIENDRLDLQHHLLTLTFDGKLHAAPLDRPLHRVLDAGCGTGIWTMDFADEHPECEVVGVDLSPIQPNAVPPNVSFFVDDLEDSWTFSSKFDYIFARFLTGSILDWPKFFQQSLASLNPGGTLELIDIIYPATSDDDTLTENSAIYKWSKSIVDGFSSNGRPIDSALKYKEQLEEAGFVNVTVIKRKWPSNIWPKDRRHKELGMWMYENAMAGLGALSLAVFTRPVGAGGLGWSPEELEVLLTDVRKEFKSMKVHAYWPVWSVYAKKPE
ncbi:S-adenosyl-L-methionine-dependent methyltransferase [Thozetella sp. PMI_491]|nr:S-adenosyl-L-methionine-dependent methyltransferase [Thozetella sp. PMI_491]